MQVPDRDAGLDANDPRSPKEKIIGVLTNLVHVLQMTSSYAPDLSNSIRDVTQGRDEINKLLELTKDNLDRDDYEALIELRGVINFYIALLDEHKILPKGIKYRLTHGDPSYTREGVSEAGSYLLRSLDEMRLRFGASELLVPNMTDGIVNRTRAAIKKNEHQ